MSRLSEFSGEDIAFFAWAFARNGVHDAILFDFVALESLPRLQEFSPQSLSRLAFAFFSVKADAPELLAAIRLEALERRGQFNHADARMLSMAFGTDTGEFHLRAASGQEKSHLTEMIKQVPG